MISVHYTNAAPGLPLLIEWQFSTYISLNSQLEAARMVNSQKNDSYCQDKLRQSYFFRKSRHLIERSRFFYAKNF